MAEVLVTGGAGFIGSHLVDYLVKKGHQVYVLDDLSGGLIENVNPKAVFIKGSITNQKLVNKIMRGTDIVYHIAAYAAEGLSHNIRVFNYMNNLVGSLNLINASIKNKVKCFVFTSSMAVYGEGKPPFSEEDIPSPTDPYGVAKFAVEMDLKCAKEKFGLDYIVFRPHNIYGERQFLGDPYRNVITIFMNRIMKGLPPLIFGDGEQTRAFSYISDIVPCIAEAPFKKDPLNQIINIGAAKPYTLNQLAEEVLNVMGSDLKPVHVEERHEVKHAHCTTEKSEKILGFADKTNLQDGLKKTAEWAKKKGPMEPIIWECVELEENLHESWKKLQDDFPDSPFRINPLKEI